MGEVGEVNGDGEVQGEGAAGQGYAVRCVVNPDKLRHLGPVSELARKPPPETR